MERANLGVRGTFLIYILGDPVDPLELFPLLVLLLSAVCAWPEIETTRHDGDRHGVDRLLGRRHDCPNSEIQVRTRWIRRLVQFLQHQHILGNARLRIVHSRGGMGFLGCLPQTLGPKRSFAFLVLFVITRLSYAIF